MKTRTEKRRYLYPLLTFALVFGIVVMMIASSFAYFRFVFDKQGVNSVMIELIFDRLNFDDPDVIAAGFRQTDENGNEIAWGSAENPYVISEKYHVQNLSVLQNAGFFENRTETDSSGNESVRQPHFLVCTRDGDPVAIDCGGMEIAPIGTDELPFTGVVRGAPFDGTVTYNGNGASVSTIANLTVAAPSSEPDIGFFGKLGYVGTFDAESETVTGGYAATVDDILFADITVSSRNSLLDTLAEWWNKFVDHINHSEDRKETHHVGIIAGHAEFATITNVSVYYSENVAAFNLLSDASGSNTNYYSATGLIGLLEYVNPTLGEGGTLDGSSGINDSDLIGDGSEGGGGSESGTLTGYFLAENLYERHEIYLGNNSLDKSDSYNVMHMKDADGSDLFKRVTMRERSSQLQSWKNRDYFYFQDTVFTFAMSMSVGAGEATEGEEFEKKSDYICKIWRLDEERPSISATDSITKYDYLPDPNAPTRVSYRMQAAESIKNGAYYVLGYYDKAGTFDIADDVLYVLDINDLSGSRGYSHAIPIGKFVTEGVTDDELNGSIEYYTESEGAGIKTINLVSSNRSVYDCAFYYDGSISFKSPFSDNKFGVTATGSLDGYNLPQTTVNTANATNGNVSGKTAYYYDFTLSPHKSDKGRYSVAASYTLGTWALILDSTTYCWSKLSFSDGAFSFYSVAKESSADRNAAISYSEENYFTVFSLNANSVDITGNITSNPEDTGNVELTPKNILPTLKDDGAGNYVQDILYTFDPSQYVLQYVKTTNENGTDIGNYKLAPLRSYKLNDGTGNLITELNHIVKLYKTVNENFRLTIGDALLGGAFNDWINTNDGGVLSTTIGSTSNELYTIPTGMIAFEINEASVEDPSYINIIVAVNPEQLNGTIGLWRKELSTWSDGFDLNNPTDYFELPISKTAKGTSDKQYIIKVVEHKELDEKIKEEEGRNVYNVVNSADGTPETSYIYLGGETVLIYHSFRVEKTGVYMLGSQVGPMSVSYFSVSGAAGAGNDGSSGSPLGKVDFVYAYRDQIITVDKMFEGESPLLGAEDYYDYYPSYLFVSMLPEEVKIQNEAVKVRRYINDSDGSGTRRHFLITGGNYTKVRGVSVMTEDVQDDVDDDN